MKFLVTKKFVSGLLDGITITDRSPVAFAVGRRVKPCVGSSEFVVVACVAETVAPVAADNVDSRSRLKRMAIQRGEQPAFFVTHRVED
jgi:hypothetical protein